MAKKTVVTETLTDDLDGTTAHRTVAFVWGGDTYEMELSNRNYAAFEKAVRPYVSAARKVRAPKRGGRTGGPSSPKERAAYLGAVREWAAAHGMEVAARGRIAQPIVDAYEAAR